MELDRREDDEGDDAYENAAMESSRRSGLRARPTGMPLEQTDYIELRLHRVVYAMGLAIDLTYV
jgi:hypothetical protein